MCAQYHGRGSEEGGLEVVLFHAIALIHYQEACNGASIHRSAVLPMKQPLPPSPTGLLPAVQWF